MRFFCYNYPMCPEIAFYSFPMTFIKLFNFILITGLLYLVLFGAVDSLNRDPLEDKYGEIVHVSLVSMYFTYKIEKYTIR